MTSQTLPQYTDEDKTKQGQKSTPVKRSTEQSMYYEESSWGTCEAGEQKYKQYRDGRPVKTGQNYQVLRVKKDGKVYALKILQKLNKKTGLPSRTQATRATREVQALRRLQGTPFINSIHDAFQTTLELFLVLDFAECGTLLDVMAMKCVHNDPFQESEIQFYLIEIVLALEAVHKKGIVHRNIKAENLLVSKYGHIQLAHFGVCKCLDDIAGTGGSNSPVGTKEFMAPELLVEEWRKDNCVFVQDWYSVGVLALWMFVGYRHFPYGGPERKLYHSLDDWSWEKVISAMKVGNPSIPTHSRLGRHISAELRDLLTQLLKVRCSDRLGRQGAEEIKRDPFFKDVNWEDAANGKLVPPYKCILEHSDASD